MVERSRMTVDEFTKIYGIEKIEAALDAYDKQRQRTKQGRSGRNEKTKRVNAIGEQEPSLHSQPGARDAGG